MSRFFIPVFLLATLAAGQPPETGRIAGSVKLLKPLKAAALPSPTYAGRTVNVAEAPKIPEIKNVVVYIKDAAMRGTLPVKTAELRQTHEMFVPHVIAITRGSRVEFPNQDPFYHNVFSLSSAANFNLGRYANGKSEHYDFKKAGLVKVYCNIHSHMSATIFVFDHPYFTIPETDGTFDLPSLPAGDYTVVGWHERVGERTAKVHVEAGRTASVELSLPVEDTP
jgi:plastocyanin